MAVERKQLLMGGAAVIVVVLAATLMWPTAQAPSAGARGSQLPPRAKSARGAAQTDQPTPVAPVKLKELAETRDEPGDTKRNPFKYQPKAAPPPPRPVVTAPPPVTEAPRPPVPTGPPPPAPIALKFIGVLERANGVKWAVLTDGKTPSPFYGKDGDIIDGRYQIVKIGTESIEMTYTDGRGRTVIRLTGQ